MTYFEAFQKYVKNNFIECGGENIRKSTINALLNGAFFFLVNNFVQSKSLFTKNDITMWKWIYMVSIY